MPEVVHYKVRVVIEYDVVSVLGYGAAVQHIEEKIAPVVKRDKGDLDGSYVQDAKIATFEAQRR